MHSDMLQWVNVICWAAAVSFGVFELLPTPSIKTTCVSSPWKFVYRNAALCVAIWFNLFVAIVLVTTAIYKPLSDPDDETNLYIPAAIISAVFTVLYILFSVLYRCMKTCCCNGCCCCCTSGGCSAEECAKNMAQRVPLLKPQNETFQSKMIASVFSLGVTSFVEPLVSSTLSTEYSGVTYAVILVVMWFVTNYMADQVALCVTAAEFSLLVSSGFVFSVAYLQHGSWAGQSMGYYATTLAGSIGLALLNVLYNALVWRNTDSCRFRPEEKEKPKELISPVDGQKLGI